MSSKMLSRLCMFDGQKLTEWDTTIYHVVNTMGYQIVLGVKPSPIITNNIKTKKSYRARENWNNQNS